MEPQIVYMPDKKNAANQWFTCPGLRNPGGGQELPGAARSRLDSPGAVGSRGEVLGAVGSRWERLRAHNFSICPRARTRKEANFSLKRQ